jgi:hypothetical protein
MLSPRLRAKLPSAIENRDTSRRRCQRLLWRRSGLRGLTCIDLCYSGAAFYRIRGPVHHNGPRWPSPSLPSGRSAWVWRSARGDASAASHIAQSDLGEVRHFRCLACNGNGPGCGDRLHASVDHRHAMTHPTELGPPSLSTTSNSKSSPRYHMSLGPCRARQRSASNGPGVSTTPVPLDVVLQLYVR